MSTRISNIKPACGYSVEGISHLRLIDFDEFDGFEFDGGTPESCRVTQVQSAGSPVEVNTQGAFTKYNAGANAHTVETFVPELSADMQRNIYLASKRRYVVLFRTLAGRWHAYGYEAGASVTFTNQTGEAIGSVLTISAQSEYPLFEVTDQAAAMVLPKVFWRLDFNNLNYCEDNG